MYVFLIYVCILVSLANCTYNVLHLSVNYPNNLLYVESTMGSSEDHLAIADWIAMYTRQETEL